MNNLILSPTVKRLLLPFCLIVFMIISYIPAKAQLKPEQPPKPIAVTVSTAQHLNFGTIIPSTISGSVSVAFNGSPTSSPGILLLHSYECSAALFIVEAEPGVLINIIYPDPNPKLANGGFNLQLHLETPNIDLQPGYQFITKTKSTYVYIGGTLTVGTLLANPAGAYSGTFDVTFIQQ